MDTKLRLVVVTPERTLLDEAVDSLRFPLYDGQIGILPGRAPLVGRLGYGELHIVAGGQTRSYFIDGGFVQVKGGTVSLLTNSAIPAENLSANQAEQELEKAMTLPATTDTQYALKQRAQERARRKKELARHA